MSHICDNYSVNQKLYKLLGGPGEVSLDGSTVFVGYDYDHEHKSVRVRNNWITEPNNLSKSKYKCLMRRMEFWL